MSMRGGDPGECASFNCTFRTAFDAFRSRSLALAAPRAALLFWPDDDSGVASPGASDAASFVVRWSAALVPLVGGGTPWDLLAEANPLAGRSDSNPEPAKVCAPISSSALPADLGP